MRLSTILLPLAASSAVAISTPSTDTVEHGMQKRECFGSGEFWGGDRSHAENRALDFCVKLGLPTNFAKDRNFHRCFNLSSLKKVDFTIKNISGASRSLTFRECVDGLKKEVNGCDRGGATSYTNWRYT